MSKLLNNSSLRTNTIPINLPHPTHCCKPFYNYPLSRYGLLTKVAANAPADSATSFTFLQMLVPAAPAFQSPASYDLYKNVDVFNESPYRLSLQERAAINARIIAKLMEQKPLLIPIRLMPFK